MHDLFSSLSRLALDYVRYEALCVRFAIQNSSLLRFDKHSTGDMHCCPYTISGSSRMGGIFGCRVMIISLKGNDSGTVFMRKPLGHAWYQKYINNGILRRLTNRIYRNKRPRLAGV